MQDAQSKGAPTYFILRKVGDTIALVCLATVIFCSVRRVWVRVCIV